MDAKEAGEPVQGDRPRFLTVEDTAVAFRIGRTTAYAAIAIDRLADPASNGSK